MSGERSGRECGECTLCCKLMAIEELSKPVGMWCAYCTPGKGCGVYETRPESCRVFTCAWLDGNLEEGERPDRLKALFTIPMDRRVQMTCHLPREMPAPSRSVEKAMARLHTLGWDVVTICGDKVERWGPPK